MSLMKRPERQGFVKSGAAAGQGHEVASAPMSEAPAVTVELTDHVATVEIHRPPHNWFGIEMRI